MSQKFKVICLIIMATLLLSIGLGACAKKSTRNETDAQPGKNGTLNGNAKNANQVGDDDAKQKVKDLMNNVLDQSGNDLSEEDKDAINDLFDFFAD